MRDELLLVEDPTQARKRRMELRARHHESGSSKRHRYDDEEDDEDFDDDCGEPDPDTIRSMPRKPSIRGFKKQARYEPGVSMSRDELAQWRKDARRVRNRESAGKTSMHPSYRVVLSLS